jgi:predicted outer membrane repeat protein
MPKRTVVPVLGVLIILSSPAFASTWYVNGVNGDDGNDCKTKATACASVRQAISRAASSDTIEIAAATYQENLSIPFSLTLNGVKAATTIIDGTDSSNVFTVGAGIRLTLSNLTIKRGVGYQGGGGVDNSGTLIVSHSNFYVNTALSGGAILNTGMAIISNTSFDGNSPYFSGHTASCGAIDNRGTMAITDSTFYNNYTNNNSTSGGAICNGGTLTITNSTFSNNSSGGNNAGYGGAIFTHAGSLVVTNSTFDGNSATTSGGAIYSQGGAVRISNSTFGNNFVAIGGGGVLGNAGSSVRIQNSIVANTANGGNCAGTITSNGHNLSNDSTCHFNSRGDLNDKNPKLSPLGANGGPTQTMALQNRSPALDAGNPAGCRDFAGKLLTTDQRGLPRPGRPETAGCDMGAFESQIY